MALTKETSYDYEIRGVGKDIQQRKKTIIFEDGVKLTDSYSRQVYVIGTSLDGVDDEATVKSLSSSLWTPAVKEAHTSHSLGL